MRESQSVASKGANEGSRGVVANKESQGGASEKASEVASKGANKGSIRVVAKKESQSGASKGFRVVAKRESLSGASEGSRKAVASEGASDGSRKVVAKASGARVVKLVGSVNEIKRVTRLRCDHNECPYLVHSGGLYGTFCCMSCANCQWWEKKGKHGPACERDMATGREPNSQGSVVWPNW